MDRRGKNIVISEFSEYIKKGINPGTKRCKTLIDKNEILLEGRTPAQINAFVDNINKKK